MACLGETTVAKLRRYLLTLSGAGYYLRPIVKLCSTRLLSWSIVGEPRTKMSARLTFSSLREERVPVVVVTLSESTLFSVSCNFLLFQKKFGSSFFQLQPESRFLSSTGLFEDLASLVSLWVSNVWSRFSILTRLSVPAVSLT